MPRENLDPNRFEKHTDRLKKAGRLVIMAISRSAGVIDWLEAEARRIDAPQFSVDDLHDLAVLQQPMVRIEACFDNVPTLYTEPKLRTQD